MDFVCTAHHIFLRLCLVKDLVEEKEKQREKVNEWLKTPSKQKKKEAIKPLHKFFQTPVQSFSVTSLSSKKKGKKNPSLNTWSKYSLKEIHSNSR